MPWHSQAYEYLVAEQYEYVIDFYEQDLEKSDELSSYWCLGLAYLLSEQEELAQTTWLFGFVKAEENRNENLSESYLAEFTKILDVEANRQQQLGHDDIAWTIRQHLREVVPTNLANLFKIVELSIKTQSFEPSSLRELQLCEILSQESNDKIICDSDLLGFLEKIFEYPSQEAINFCKSCLLFVNNSQEWIRVLLKISIRVGEQLDLPGFAADILEICLQIDPNNQNNNTETLKYLCNFSANSNRFERAIEIAKIYCKSSNKFSDIFLSNYQLLRTLTRAGMWLEVLPVINKNKDLLRQIFENTTFLNDEIRPYIITSASFLAYAQDNIEENRYFQNQVGNLFTKQTNRYSYHGTKAFQKIKQKGKRKIGYIGSTLRAHSVGWLGRWIFQHHNRNDFDISIYAVNQLPEDNFYKQWFAEKVDHSKIFSLNPHEIAQQIYDDEIEILIDLDSVTFNVTYEVMALKPAPIQVSWLGWDAPGLSTVDYFIADPYVLPQNAQEHYQEKIWRLPQTYVAVDGFEIGTPELTRKDLNIPCDAVVFFSSQTGSKRHPETIRLQLQILKEVPNSYFLIKAIGDIDAVKEIFMHLADHEGVTPDRLRFIGFTNSEYTHRANLQLVDVVLDTYPYNGATTTLETLWMGIPLVTRVGNTFSDRNSYAFMSNVGLTEGIAWTDAEYIDWGIRLGRDESLRQRIAYKLWKSRQVSPLWNAKQFTCEMENAYNQMWMNYLDTK
jgi:predicted O-linked N-acetylglucosamine transferase (SPINDLY family)